MNQDTLFGVTYVPPLHMRFYNNVECDLFETEICQMSIDYDYLHLCWDFNAKPSELKNYTTSDSFLGNQFDLETQNFIDQKAVLEANNIKLNRSSMDKTVNSHGYKLIYICKSKLK